MAQVEKANVDEPAINISPVPNEEEPGEYQDGKAYSKEYALGQQSIYSVGPSAMGKTIHEVSNARLQEIPVAD